LRPPRRGAWWWPLRWCSGVVIQWVEVSVDDEIDLFGEGWAWVPGSSFYRVSVDGQVYVIGHRDQANRRRTQRRLIPSELGQVTIVDDGGDRRRLSLGRIVWEAFRGPIHPFQRVRRISKEGGYRLANLRLCVPSITLDAERIDLVHRALGGDETAKAAVRDLLGEVEEPAARVNPDFEGVV
jgi:hypothetical protein